MGRDTSFLLVPHNPLTSLTEVGHKCPSELPAALGQVSTARQHLPHLQAAGERNHHTPPQAPPLLSHSYSSQASGTSTLATPPCSFLRAFTQTLGQMVLGGRLGGQWSFWS